MGGAGVNANFSHMTLDGPSLNQALRLMSGLVSTLQTDVATVQGASTQVAGEWTSTTGQELASRLASIAQQLQTMETNLSTLNNVLISAVSSIDAAEQAVTSMTTSSPGVG